MKTLSGELGFEVIGEFGNLNSEQSCSSSVYCSVNLYNQCTTLLSGIKEQTSHAGMKKWKIGKLKRRDRHCHETRSLAICLELFSPT